MIKSCFSYFYIEKTDSLRNEVTLAEITCRFSFPEVPRLSELALKFSSSAQTTLSLCETDIRSRSG